MIKKSYHYLGLHATFFRLFAFLCVLICGCRDSNSQHKEPIEGIEDKLCRNIQLEGNPRIYYTLEERMTELNIKGFSAVIVQNGKIVETSFHGIKNDKGEAVNESTLFQAASISKPITALGILKLVQQKKVDLDIDVNTYLKGFRLNNPFEEKGQYVTLRTILNHSAGLNVGGFGGYPEGTVLPTVIEALKGEGNSPQLEVVEPPNSRWNYSGGGYMLLGKIIEDVTGLPFEVYMKNEILDPLGMTKSTFGQPIDTTLHDNLSYAYTTLGEPYDGNWHNYAAQGAGGLWTTPTDLAQYCIGVYKAYKGQDHSIFEKSTIEQMMSPSLRNWGLGPLVVNKGDGLIFTHDGSNAGFKADFFAYIEKGHAAIAMANSENGADLCVEYLQAVCSHYGWKAREPFVVKSIDLTADQQSNYLGVYEWLDRSTYTIEISRKENQLTLEYFDDGQSNALELEFMDLENAIHIETGQRLRFRISNTGKVTGVLWRNRFEFKKR